jgi:hypothetical protein
MLFGMRLINIDRNGAIGQSLKFYVRLSHVQESELFELAWHVETWSWGSCWVEGQIAGWFAC